MRIKILLDTDEGDTYLSVKEISKARLDQATNPVEVIQEAMEEASKSVVEMWEDA